MSGEGGRAASPRTRVSESERVTIPISGFACGGGGALTAERALARLPGVIRVYVNPATEMAYVEFDPALATPDQLVGAIDGVGFRAGQVRQV